MLRDNAIVDHHWWPKILHSVFAPVIQQDGNIIKTITKTFFKTKDNKSFFCLCYPCVSLVISVYVVCLIIVTRINKVMMIPTSCNGDREGLEPLFLSCLLWTFMDIIIQTVMPVGGYQRWRWNRPFSCFMIAIPSPRCFLIQGQSLAAI